MEIFDSVFLSLLPTLLVAAFIYMLFNLHAIAKKGGKIAFAVGIFIQMFMPDPKVQQTMEMVVKQKERNTVQSEQLQDEGKDD